MKVANIDLHQLVTIDIDSEDNIDEGWYVIEKDSDDNIEIRKNQYKHITSERIYFPKNFDRHLCHTSLPLNIYEDGSLFYDDNGIMFYPRFIQKFNTQEELKKFIEAIGN